LAPSDGFDGSSIVRGSAAGAHVISARADRRVLKRRSETFDRTANGYLDTEHPGLECIPRKRADDASALELVEGSQVLRRDAINLLQSAAWA
jgi:hypothetical protein